MINKIKLPPGGQNTDQLMITKWRKEIGDDVRRGDVLVEIETDKATLEIESFAAGTLLEIFFAEGEYATVGEVIAYIGDPDEYQKEVKVAREQSGDRKEDEFVPIVPTSASEMIIEEKLSALVVTTEESIYKVTPAAKKVFKDAGIDAKQAAAKIDKVVIKKKDALAYLEEIKGADLVPTEDMIAMSDFYEIETIPLTSMRKTIAARMLESTTQIPSYTVEVDVDMEETIRFREQSNAIQNDVKVSYNDILAKVVSVAVKKFKFINSSYTDTAIKVYKNVNVGFAVSLEGGLVVPVVKNIEQKGILEIAAENRQYIDLVRSGKFSQDLLDGGTITISNLGMYPVSRFTAIINPPEVCILAVGAIKDTLYLEDGQVKQKAVMTITASFDHRIVDGAYGAEFLKYLKQLIESPALLAI